MANSDADQTGGMRVVIVEDNEDSREMLGELLTRAGFECRAAADGLSAVTLIDEFAPHAAIVDVGLPDIDGFEVARRVRAGQRNPHLLLVALTGYGEASDRARAVDAGFDTHLVKPIRLDQLRALIASHASTA